MEFMEKTMEMRAVKRDEIMAYFLNLNGKDEGQGRIHGEDWEVEVGEEKPVKLGSFTIPAIIIVFRCKKELFDPMYSSFQLKFFRAGG